LEAAVVGSGAFRDYRQHLVVVLGEAAQVGPPLAELLIDYPEWMLKFRAVVSFGHLDRGLKLSIWCIR